MIIITGCSRIYKLNQLAKIDNINIKAITAKKVANNTLEIVFEIKNNTKNTITISPEKNFKFYGINKVLIPNNYDNDNNIIKSKETINYTLHYNIENKEIYDILFYSSKSSNSIKFSLTKLDLK
jgi:hypothetical protein